MAFKFSDIKVAVEEICDGRGFDEEKHARWANRLRKTVVMDVQVAGFHSIYFLYKEATVSGGSVLNEPKYAIPDDYVDDLSIWYNENYIPKAPATMINILQSPYQDPGTPRWYKMAGLEFEFIPAPDEAGNEIKLLYGSLADEIPSASNDNTTDYFLTHWPDLHIHGMSAYAARSIGLRLVASDSMQLFSGEMKKLQLHNRRHWIKHARIRLQNWEEFVEFKTVLFPQFGNL